MKSTLAPLAALALLLSRCEPVFAHQDRPTRADSLSCSELLDIRNFDRVPRRTPFSYSLTLRLADMSIQIHFMPKADPSGRYLLVQKFSTNARDPVLQRTFLQTYFRIFKDLLVSQDDGFVAHSSGAALMRLKATTADDLEKRVRAFADLFRGKMLTPIETPAATMNPDNRSERVLAVRELMVQFLARSGLPIDSDYIQRQLNSVHREFLDSLNMMELTLFHYSIFDREATFEARMKMDERLPEWKKLGYDEFPTAEQLIEGLRRKFMDVATRDFQAFSERRAKALEARKLLTGNRLVYLIDQKHRLRQLAAEVDQLIESEIDAASPPWYERDDSDPLQERRKELFSKRHWLRVRLGNLDRYITIRRRQLNDLQNVALQVIEADQTTTRSNFNPYALDIDHAKFFRQPKATLSRQDSPLTGAGNKEQQFEPGGLTRTGGPGPVFERSHWGESLAEGGAADSARTLERAGMSRNMAATLNAHGIRHVWEITRHSARDFVERFHFSRDELNRLLDELNALGVHLHFDDDWDRDNLRVRKERPEYYQYRHTPRSVVKWRDAPSPSTDADAQTRPRHSGEWD